MTRKESRARVQRKMTRGRKLIVKPLVKPSDNSTPKVKDCTSTPDVKGPVMKGTEHLWFERDCYTIRGEIELLRFLNPPKGATGMYFINLKFNDDDEYTINLGTNKCLDFVFFEGINQRVASLYLPSGHAIAVNLDYAANIDRVLTVLQLESLYDRKEYDRLYEKYLEPLGKASGKAVGAYVR